MRKSTPEAPILAPGLDKELAPVWRIHPQVEVNMLTTERPYFRTVDHWAIGLLMEAHAIHRCEEHGCAKDRADPHAREEAFRIAREDPPRGLSADQAVAAIHQVLDSIGDTCPECE